jgi:peptidoglycan/xylan/chitin deacetylase (PgdA/CDA1 family)
MESIRNVEIKQPIPDKLIVLTFDDASSTHAKTVAPLLLEYGFGATFFICEFSESKGGSDSKFCPGFEDKNAYMTWEQISDLYNKGFEIGNHTLKHSHVDRISLEELIEEIDAIDNKCISYGIPKPVSFCYPAYKTSEEALKILEGKGFLWARTGGGVYDPLAQDPLLIPSYHPSILGDIEAFKAVVNKAKDGKIVVLVLHGVPDLAHPWVSMKEEFFKEYMDYLYKNNFTVIPMRDLNIYINPL